MAVVGGGDTACEEAYYLSNLAQKVYLIVRKDYLRASKVMQKRVMDKDNITILFNTNTLGLFGSEFLEGAHLVEHVGTDKERKFDINIDGFFLAIGHNPNTEIFKGQVDLDAQGYVVVSGGSTATSVPEYLQPAMSPTRTISRQYRQPEPDVAPHSMPSAS